MKTCNTCGLTKPEDEFVPNKNKCKLCRAAYMREYYQRPEAQAKQKERVNSKRGYRSPEQRRREKARTYGFESGEELDAWMAEQPEICPICQVNPVKHLDHCHTQMKPRGMLCGPCNSVLGFAHDDVEVLQRAIVYLQTHIGVPRT